MEYIKNTFWNRLFYSKKWLVNHVNDWRNLAITSIDELERINEYDKKLLETHIIIPRKIWEKVNVIK